MVSKGISLYAAKTKLIYHSLQKSSTPVCAAEKHCHLNSIINNLPITVHCQFSCMQWSF